MSTLPVTDINAQLSKSSPQETLKYALEEHDNIAVSFSGAEDVVLVHMAAQIKPGVKIFCLDTGRLHSETYQFIEKVRTTYDMQLEILFPDANQVEKLVREKGFYSFYEDMHQECCGIRKVGPLRRHLLTLDAWITGQRKDQSPGTRAEIPVIQLDKAFARPGESLIKYNPLANWSSEQVWEYIRAMDIPFNELHHKGFISIGCEPCTRAVLPGEHERNGRWWWEEATKKECGLHSGNVKK
ncbi:phosphoadenylyl-sulfate reductase [Agaribacterium sp. ZY112]|uniref:phosphoadenylyl-sulfate reductase n=1 Tax=Agaribacterium sp. ZY112 TaxID=3233574 RepID=UPI00352607AF